MRKYLRLFLTMAVFGLISAFSYVDAKAADLPPLEDDPLAYYYSDTHKDRSEAFPKIPDDTAEKKLRTYNMPSFGTISGKNSGISHNSRFDSAKIRYGIDVSYYQGSIDWNAVKNSGVEFVFIRAGYRGLTTGSLNNDIRFTEYIRGALAADLKVGVYFFSQAITPAEAEEEADFVLNRIAGYKLSLPVVIDYEYGGSDGGRIYNANLSKEAATSICAAFCQKIQSSGYTPMVYANKNMLENNLDGAYLGEAYNVWLAHYTNQTSYAHKYSFWQYTSSGSVPGISTQVDMDVWYDTSQTPVSSENAEKYITQVYSAFLNRPPDSAELAGYVKALTQDRLTAAQLVSAVITSDEFCTKGYSNSECIDRIYQAMLGRGADAYGKTTWLHFLDQGVSPLFIVNGFCGSEEFKNLCAKYQISSGGVTLTEPRDQNPQITGFVNRCYQTALLRNPDAPGLNNWCGQLLRKTSSPEDIAFGFVFSQEAGIRYPSNEAFVDMLYRLCLGRGADAYGKANWLYFLNSGSDRYSIFLGFTRSEEFKRIIKQYGF